MGSIVLFDKDKKYDCFKCMDKSNWLAQGRPQEYADQKIRNKLRAKGCLSDSKTEVFRLNDGRRIYRCPRSTSDDVGSLIHYQEISEITNGNCTYDGDKKPWKWHQVKRRITYEISQVRKLEATNARINQQHQKR